MAKYLSIVVAYLCIALELSCTTAPKTDTSLRQDIGSIMDLEFRAIGLLATVGSSPKLEGDYGLSRDDHGVVLYIKGLLFHDVEAYFRAWLGEPYMRSKTVKGKVMVLYRPHDIGLVVQINEVDPRRTEVVAIRVSPQQGK